MLFENRLFLFSLSMTTNEIASAAHSRMMTAERTSLAILPRFNLFTRLHFPLRILRIFFSIAQIPISFNYIIITHICRKVHSAGLFYPCKTLYEKWNLLAEGFIFWYSKCMEKELIHFFSTVYFSTQTCKSKKKRLKSLIIKEILGFQTKKSPHEEMTFLYQRMLPFMVGVGRLELPASTSQMSRATNCAIPRFLNCCLQKT